MGFELRDVMPWGRSFDEYLSMFGLTPADLHRSILGCGDGPASFNAALSRQGGSIVSCDPMYRFSATELQRRIDEAAPLIAAETTKNADEFVWDHFDSVDALIAARMHAMSEFLLDYPDGLRGGRYVDASLPELPFPNDAFDLALCAHFLFLYSAQHDLDFHVRSIQELLRVAPEARIFPLLELGSVPSRHLQPAVDALGRHDVSVEIVEVPYEFQKGGNEMLRLRRPDSSGRA